MPNKKYDEFWSNVSNKKRLRDPLTGLHPTSERELNAVLALKHQFREIQWAKVPLYDVAKTKIDEDFAKMDKNKRHKMTSRNAGLMIDDADKVLLEYPLFAEPKTLRDSPVGPKGPSTQVDRWGAMIPDMIFVRSSDRKSSSTMDLTLVECKVDSSFTHGDKGPNGQLARYLEFLGHVSSQSETKRKCALMLICPQWNCDWYAERLINAEETHKELHKSVEVTVGLALWEDIFSAFASPS